jgi:hypothetical protein
MHWKRIRRAENEVGVLQEILKWCEEARFFNVKKGDQLKKKAMKLPRTKVEEEEEKKERRKKKNQRKNSQEHQS